MFCYIILHYKVLEETLACVQSIKESNPNSKRLVIIDNFSNNGTGEKLQELYRSDKEIDVLIHYENAGFARGNNVAYQFAKERYNPDFMVIMNNDIEIETEDFETVVSDIYRQEGFHILGPDIFSTTYQLHQNPKRLKSYTYKEVEELNERFKRESQPSLALKIKCWLKASKTLRTFVYQNRRNKKEVDFTKQVLNPILHGSFLIYSKDYIAREEFAFNPNTFFYFETEILDYEAEHKGYKRLYTPNIKVLHHQNVATNQVYSNLLEKTLFSNKCNFESTSYFLKLMEEDKVKNKINAK